MTKAIRQDGQLVDPRTLQFDVMAAQMKADTGNMMGVPAHIMRQRIDTLVYPADLIALQAELTTPVENELIGRTLFDVDTSAGPTAIANMWNDYERLGNARVQDYTDDVEMVDNKATPHFKPIVPIISGYLMNIQELRIARARGVSIDASKAATARRFVADVENDLIFNGDATFGIEGLFNFTGRVEQSVTNGSWSDVGTTAEEIADDITLIYNKLDTLDGYTPRSIVFNTVDAQWLLKRFAVGQNLVQFTVLDWLRQTGWFADNMIKKSQTVPSGSFAIMDNVPDNVRLSIPLDIMAHDPVKKNAFVEEVDVEQRFGGLLVKRTKFACIGTGV